MHIKSANVNLTSQHQFQHSERQVSVNIAQNRLVAEQSAAIVSTASVVNLSRPQSSLVNSVTSQETAKVSPDTNDLETNLLKALVEAMTGKKITTNTFETTISNTHNHNTEFTSPTLTANTRSKGTPPETSTITMSLAREYEYSEVTVSAQLATEHSGSLDIQLSVIMERHYEESGLEVLRRQGIITDPLVINFNSDTVKLSPNTVNFDLNSDGAGQWIPGLVSNSAYIALDNNGDGIINNGSELFGPSTGHGFNELAQFDDDNNGFINSNDSVYSHLVAFNPNSDTTKTLHSLGVEVLFLGSIESPFRLTDHNNNTLGDVRSTSFYVNSDALAGSVQQIDLLA